MERPRPVPLPFSLVLKKGSNMRERVSSSIPMPSSLTVSITPACPARSGCTDDQYDLMFVVSIANPPPSGIASRAFTTRFMITCSTCPGSALTRPSAGSRRNSSSISGPSSEGKRSEICEIRALRSSSLGWRICLRLKASNCRVNEAAFSDALRISLGCLCNPSVKLRLFSSTCACPWITSSKLLKLWATPPASRPTASILSAWRSSSSTRSRSAISFFNCSSTAVTSRARNPDVSAR